MSEKNTVVTSDGKKEAAAAAAEESAVNQVEVENPRMILKYTDVDVDRIVAKRLDAERKRAAKVAENDSRESELTNRERSIAERERRITAIEKLVDEGLPKTLADCLNYGSDDLYNESYKNVVGAFNAAVEAKVRAYEADRARGRTPQTYKNSGDNQLKEAFAKKA